jgi:hypothetical protein
MQSLRTLGAALLGAVLSAQSPLTTLFVSNNGGSVGGGVYFDLTVAAGGVTVTGLDINTGSAANTAGTIEFWIRPGQTHIGNLASTAGWINYATGPILAAGLNLPTNCVFTTPAPLPAGLYGVAIRHIGVGARYTNGTGSNQNYSNAELALAAGSAGNAFLTGASIAARVFNGSIHYTNGSANVNFGTAVVSGTSCEFSPSGRVSFYENFPVAGFDLSNTSMVLTPTGTGYAVTAGTSTFVAPTGVGLALTDDSTSTAQAMPFTFTFPGGSTNQLRICSNGFIFLNGTGTSTDLSPTPAELLTLGPRLFPLWMDMLPDGATNINNVYYEVDPGNTFVRVTWLNVPEFGQPTNINTLQVTIRANGTVEYLWQACANVGAGHLCIVGFSPGAANRDPGNRDLSTAMPFVTQADTPPAPTQNATRPILGSVCNLTVGTIPGGSLVGLELLGFPIAPIDLTGAGMPGCNLYVNMILSIPFATGAASATTPLPIPNDASLLGGQIGVQAVIVNFAANAFGALTTNLVTLTIGNA